MKALDLSRSTALLLLCLAAVGLVLIATKRDTSASAAGSESETAAAVSDDLNISLFATKAAAKIPFLEAGSLRVESGFDLSTARVAQTDGTGSSVVIVRKTDLDSPPEYREQVCVFATAAHVPTAAAGACAPVAEFAQDGLVSTLSTPDPADSEVIGLVPDGVKSISVLDEDGDRRSIPVANNVYRFRIGGAQTVAYADGGSEVLQDIPRPLD